MVSFYGRASQACRDRSVVVAILYRVSSGQVTASGFMPPSLTRHVALDVLPNLHLSTVFYPWSPKGRHLPNLTELIKEAPGPFDPLDIVLNSDTLVRCVRPRVIPPEAAASHHRHT